MNQMTVQAGSVLIGRANSPTAQTLVPGGTSVLMANLQFDASQSGEDIRFASAPVKLIGGGSFTAAAANLTNCQLFDGSTALNTNTVFNPATSGTLAVGTSSNPYMTGTISLNNPITVAKGTVKTLGMRCNIASGADNNSTFSWDVQDASTWSFSGATSGTTISGTDSATDSAVVVTIGAGSATVTNNSLGQIIASAGTANVTNGSFRFRASNEDMNLTKLGLTITSSASSTDSDIVKATIWDGSTKVGDAFFQSGATSATSTLMTPVLLAKGIDHNLTVKLDLSTIGYAGSGAPVSASGHLIAIDYLNAQATGVSSGSTFNLGTSAGTTAAPGIRVFKSFPSLAQVSLPNGTVPDGTNLMRFSVTADAVGGPVSIARFNFTVSTTTAGTAVTNVNLFGYTDSAFTSPIGGVSTGGQVKAVNLCGGTAGECNSNAYVLTLPAQTSSGSGATPNTVITIPAGSTYYFALKGTIAAVTGSSINTNLLGDSSFPSVAGGSANGLPMVAVANATLSARNFIWSPNSTTTSAVGDVDWTDGFLLTGLSQSGIIQGLSK